MRTFALLTLAGLGLLLTAWLAGCDDSASHEKGITEARTHTEEHGEHHADDAHGAEDHHEAQGHHGGHQHDTDRAHGDADSPAPADIDQKTCPVMGDPIDPDVLVEHEGRKIYFCCKDCIKKFKANPDKYLTKLDQKDN